MRHCVLGRRRQGIRRPAARAALLASGALAACDDGPAPPQATSLSVTPSSVALSSLGDTALFSATIRDQYGEAFDGRATWRTSRPSVFTVSPAGVARAVGNGAGVLTASFEELSATASVAVAQAPAALEVVSGDGQAARQGRALAEAVVVQVDDAGGSAVAGVSVTFAPAAGDGAVDPGVATTGADGRARTVWTLGDRPGVQSLAVSATGSGGPSGRVAATALTPEETADSVRIAAGDGQRVLRGRTLPDSVTALVLDAAGEPVAGARVAFTPADGDGTADPDTAATAEDGRARASWTLGDRAGRQRLIAAVTAPGGPSAEAAAIALTPEETADSVRIAAGDGQRVLRGRTLPDSVTALVLDAAGEPVAGARVAFTPADGDGTADPDTAATAEDGRARTSWTLGDRAGRQRLIAAVATPGGPSAEAAATALAPEEAAATLRIDSGDGQRVLQGRALPNPVVARVLDAAGEPVAGARVAFTPADGDGTADPDTAATAQDGRARTSWTLGDRAGRQSLTAAVAVSGGPSATAAATALTREQTVATLRVAAGDEQRAVHGETLPAPVVVELRDDADNPVPNVEVSFAPAPGHGRANPSAAASDAQGRAQTQWTLGDPAGTQTMTASVSGGPSVTATATAVRPTTNTPPAASAEIPTLILQVGGPTVDLRGSSYFSDADGDALAYTAASRNPAYASASVQEGEIAIRPVSPGTVRVIVAAADPSGATASQTIWAAVLPAPDNDGYDIDLLDFSGPAHNLPSAALDANRRWEQVVTGDLANLRMAGEQTYAACGQRFLVFAEVDDLVVFVSVVDIDGESGTLARAGPCLIRRDNGLSVFGQIDFDAADLDYPLYDVSAHEIGHVLGIGPLWPSKGLLANPSSEGDPLADTHFTGAAARAAFDSAGGAAYTGAKVPVHNGSVPGRSNMHWRASVLRGELMDPFLYSGANPLSEVTIQSLADLGYAVDPGQADSWVLPERSGDLAAAIRRGEAIPLGNDVVRTPIVVVDDDGRVVRTIRR